MKIGSRSLIICICISLFLSVYASYTIIDNINGSQYSTSEGGMNQKTRTISLGDMKFVNRGNDDQMLGNFFTGYYYDEAFGVFNLDSISGEEVQVSFQLGNCSGGNFVGNYYSLTGYSYSDNFGLIDFGPGSLSEVGICIDEDIDSITYGDATFQGYVYSPYIGIQYLDGITFEAYTDIEQLDRDEDGVLGRFIKIDGITNSSYNELSSDFDQEVRVLGNIEKSIARKSVVKNIYTTIRNTTPSNGTFPYTAPLGLGDTWPSVGQGRVIGNGSILYFGDMGNESVRIEGEIIGSKTLIVEGGNIYITGNITGSGILGLAALSKQGQGGNVYVDPSVTDIHGIIYADASFISYNGTDELDGSTWDADLANQLYVQGSIFSENTLGGGTPPYTCPFNVSSDSCLKDEAQKYDLNFIRRYKLVDSYDADGVLLGQIPDYNGREAEMGDGDATNTSISSPEYRKYPFIIEYDSRVQTAPPPLF